MATLGSFFPPRDLSLLAGSHRRRRASRPDPIPAGSRSRPSVRPLFSAGPTRNRVAAGSVAEDRKAADVPVAREEDSTAGDDSSEPAAPGALGLEAKGESGGLERLVGRGVNAALVLGFGTLAVTRLLTVDHDYWHGWTLYEVLRYAPEHNWIAYEEALKMNPVLAKMAISGVVYSIGDWIAQCYEGKPLFEFDPLRMFRSGLVGFTLHGSLSHYYYQFCEALFPFEDWWVVPAKVAFDQTVWAALWNSIYFVILGLLRLESPPNILNELKATFLPMLTAGWKLWPFAHLITYGSLFGSPFSPITQMRSQKQEYLRHRSRILVLHEAVNLRNRLEVDR
ncbi:hypothetical protein NL676_017507 [Syzygium grande]|nr:hypothetical protein NL676_017507 [Syzygium grande]